MEKKKVVIICFEDTEIYEIHDLIQILRSLREKIPFQLIVTTKKLRSVSLKELKKIVRNIPD